MRGGETGGCRGGGRDGGGCILAVRRIHSRNVEMRVKTPGVRAMPHPKPQLVIPMRVVFSDDDVVRLVVR